MQPTTIKDTDVLIAGGGMAGTFAALAAAHHGARVTLIEPSNVLGGQGTAGGVAGFCGDTERVNAPFAQLVDTLLAHGKIAPYNPTADRRAYDLETCGFFLQEMVVEAGVEVLLHARVLDAQQQNGRVSDILVSCGSDLIAFQPAFAIDATGDCTIAQQAGFATQHEKANVQLPMSLYFTLWDTGKSVKPFLPPGCPTWDGDDDLPMTTLHVFDSGKVEVKMKVVGFDASSGPSLSQAELHARRQMMGLIYHLQSKGYQGRRLDRHELASVSRHIGQREGRRLVGEYLLTEHDVTHQAAFADAVAVGTYHLDYHWPDKAERAGTGITTMVEPYHIPLCSLVAKDSTNLMAVGRSAAGDQMAMSSFRVQATCAQTGFAAGTAAAVCLAQDTDLSAAPIASIQHALEASGQTLDLSAYGDYLRHQIHVHEPVFTNNNEFAACHASTLVQLRNGRFLVAWFGGSRESHSDVGIWGATRSGCIWSTPRLLARVRNAAHWNPVLFKNTEGCLHLFFKVSVEGSLQNGRHRIFDGWETWCISTADDGETWSQARPLVEGDTQGRGPVKNKPILLANGHWLAGASTETPEEWEVFFDYSTDAGTTWTASAPVAMDRNLFTGKGAIQPTLWESAPGQVHALVRTTAGCVGRCDSTDSGRTWSPLARTDLPNNNSGLDLARLHDGTLALVCNPVTKGRTPLSILLSSDNGHSWPRRLDIETEAGEYSYPAIVPTAGGLAVTYTWQRQHIAFWMGSVERISEA
ncbi:MAG: FAD-dependent oxidoreductase [Candidatus Latescibacteria bacterium]|nr:FAD-dependent oxidoreductase [Candidatus Latescibacterota bacterium]